MIFSSNELKRFWLLLSIYIGCDVLEKYKDVVGRTRDQRRVCGARGGATVHLYGMQAFALAIVVNYTASRSCTMAESEADCGFRCCVR
jgi:hypothetical protein